MEEVQRPAEPNLCEISEIEKESSFLLSMQGLIDRQLKCLEKQKEKESELVRLGNQQRDQVVKKYEHKISELQILVHDLLKDKEESRNELLMQKAEHLQIVEALEVKVKSLVENADDQDLKGQKIIDLQDKHQTEVKKLKEGMVNLKLTNDNLLSKLNEANYQLKVQEESWKAKCDELDMIHERKLSKAILNTRKSTQATQIILDNKFKAELKRTSSLREQLGAVSNERTALEHSHKQLIAEHTALEHSHKQLMNVRTPMEHSYQQLIDERTLLEDICLQLKKKCRGPFGRRMQEREVELAKMKSKMQETQTVTLTQMRTLTQTRTLTVTRTLTETQTPTETTYGGTTRDADGPRPLAPYSLLNRLPHVHD